MADGLNPDGSSPASQPWSSPNAMQLPAVPGPMLLSEWNDDGEQTVKRTKRRHEPRVIDLPLAEKVMAEVPGVDPAAEVIPTSPLAISKPYFEATWPTNVSVILGQPVVLKCRTRLLGDRMVRTAYSSYFVCFFFLQVSVKGFVSFHTIMRKF